MLSGLLVGGSAIGQQTEKPLTLYDIPHLSVKKIEANEDHSPLFDAKKTKPSYHLPKEYSLQKDFEALGWPLEERDFGVADSFSDGKILYGLTDVQENRLDRGVDITTKARYALVLYDDRQKTKTLITSDNGQYLHGEISSDGEFLQLGFSLQPGGHVGNYVFDSQGSLAYHRKDLTYTGCFSKEGKIFYTELEIVDLSTKTAKTIPWNNLSRYWGVLSPRAEYVAATTAVFSSEKTEAGQFGIQVYTPGRMYFIRSSQSLYAKEIDDHGKITDSLGYILELHDGTYTCMAPDGKPFDIKVTSWPAPK